MSVCIMYTILISSQIYAEGSEDVPASSATALEYFRGAAKKVSPPILLVHLMIQ